MIIYLKSHIGIPIAKSSTPTPQKKRTADKLFRSIERPAKNRKTIPAPIIKPNILLGLNSIFIGDFVI